MRLATGLLLALLALGCSQDHRDLVFKPNSGGGGVTPAVSSDPVQTWIRAYGGYESLPRITTWPTGVFNASAEFQIYRGLANPVGNPQYYNSFTVTVVYRGTFSGTVLNGTTLQSSSFKIYPDSLADSLGFSSAAFTATYSDSDSTFIGSATLSPFLGNALGSPCPVKLWREGHQPGADGSFPTYP